MNCRVSSLYQNGHCISFLLAYQSAKHLQQLRGDRLQQAHVLGAPDGQTIQTVVPYDLGYRPKRLTELAQDVLANVVLLDAHMHEAFGTSGCGSREEK